MIALGWDGRTSRGARREPGQRAWIGPWRRTRPDAVMEIGRRQTVHDGRIPLTSAGAGAAIFCQLFL